MRPVSSFTDIAILWQRGRVRCILKGDHVSCALVLMDDQRLVRGPTPMPDEATAIGSAAAWLHDHQDPRPYRRRAWFANKTEM